MCKTQYGITKDDAFKILDNINMWIGNCDGKASTILAGIGIITAVVFSSDVFSRLYSIVIGSFSKSGWLLIFSVILWISIISMFAGAACFVMTLIPRLRYSYKVKSKDRPKFDSIMFYGAVGDLEFSSYKTKADKITNDKVMDDLYFQITSAAKICKTKFQYLRKGIIFFFVGLLFFVITVGVFAIVK